MCSREYALFEYAVKCLDMLVIRREFFVCLFLLVFWFNDDGCILLFLSLMDLCSCLGKRLRRIEMKLCSCRDSLGICNPSLTCLLLMLQL